MVCSLTHERGTQTLSFVEIGTQTPEFVAQRSIYERPLRLPESRAKENIIEKVGMVFSIAMMAACCLRGNFVGLAVCGVFAARFALMGQSKENLGPELSRIVRVACSLAAMTFCCLSGNLVSIIVAAIVL